MADFFVDEKEESLLVLTLLNIFAKLHILEQISDLAK